MPFIKGYKHTEEAKKKMSLLRKGKKHSEEWNKKISIANKNKKRSNETKIRMSIVNTGKKLSEKTKKKISNALKEAYKSGKRIMTNEIRKKISEKQIGKNQLEETKRKISIANKGRKQSNEAKKKMSLFQKGKKHSKEWNEKVSKAKIGIKPSEEIRKKLSIIRKEGLKTGKFKLPDKSSNTSIELAMKGQFEKNNIKYEQQKYMENVGFVDFFLPNFNIIIECDGTYWHRLPEQKEKDRNRDLTSLFIHKYKTIRLQQLEIEKSPEKCLRKIIESI